MKQFVTILKFELKNYLKNKTFIGITAFLVVAITVVMFFPRVSALIKSDEQGGGDSTDTSEIMLVSAEDQTLAEAVRATFEISFPEYDVRIAEHNEENVKNAVAKGEAECAFFMKDMTTFVYYVETLSMYDTNAQVAGEVLQNVYRTSAMINSGVSPEDAAAIMSAQITGETVSLGKDQMENFFYTYIMIFALYFVIILYGQMVATGVATEKSSRAMEVLITSAKPMSMMFGKVLAACLAGLTQLVAIFGSAIVFYKINESYWGDNPIIQSVFGMPAELFVYMIIFFVLGFLIYAFLYAAIGSTATKLEDINISVMPITYTFIIAFMVVMFSMSSGNVDNVLMRVCSYIPFTSPMAMFTRIAMSTVPLWEILISIAVLVASVTGVGIISAKIYRIGVILYGTPPKIGAIIKAIKNNR